MKPISPWQFTFFRILFGLYLALHFAELIPYAAELFSAAGILQNPALNFTSGLFPNPYAFNLPPTVVAGSIAALTLCSLLFAAGIKRHWMAVILWFGWTALFHRNNLISNPGLPYVGLLLLLTTLIPVGEPLSRNRAVRSWEMPKWVPRTAWILLMVGYTFSGYTKLSSPSWIDGSAMHYLLENPLARPGIARDALLLLPPIVLKLMTWSTLAIELFCAPLALWRTARLWIWLALVLMHLGIMMVVNFTDLTLGMLMIHAFTFDPNWVRPRNGIRLMIYDGKCLMCSKAVQFFAREDQWNNIRFTSLQGDHGLTIATRHGETSGETMLVEYQGQLYRRSEAVLTLLSALGGIWSIAATFGRAIPHPLRDALYRFIAARRHRLFSKTSCTLPPPEVQSRLLSNEGMRR